MTKKNLLLLTILLVSVVLRAQTPERISYQAVVRVGDQNTLLTNAVCGVQISILQQSENGLAVYVEQHTATTNANGLLTLAIGGGTVQSGLFETIDWANGPYFVKTEIDPNGGAVYLISSTTQLLTVPYALHSKTAETVSGTVSFEQITDVPAGFSGDYNALENKPELFSGNYADLSGKPTLFSGNYADLADKPALANVATSGSYNDLTDKPVIGENGFSGNYADLSGIPNIKDSIETFGFDGNYSSLVNVPMLFSGNYDDLAGKPTLAHVATTGSYNDLTDKPVIGENGFSGDYSDLSGKPNIKDSIAVFGFSGEYDDLKNKPTFFSGSYNDLTDKPVIGGNGFSGAYSDLSDLPNIKDSILLYGFDGDYDKLTNKPNIMDSIAKYIAENGITDGGGGQLPSGTNTGDILYWNEDNWTVLPIGLEGQFLSVADGKLAWIEPYYANTNASVYSVGDIYYNSAGEPEGIVVELSLTGRYAKIIALTESSNIVWDPLAVEEAFESNFSGDKPAQTNATDAANGMNNMQAVKSKLDWESKYPAFAAAQVLGADWYVPSQNELDNLYESRNLFNEKLQSLSAQTLDGEFYWSSTESSDFFAWGKAFTDYVIQMPDPDPADDNIIEDISISSGSTYENLKSEMATVRPMRRLSWTEASSKPTGKIYSVGDIYYENEIAIGIVYAITHGGAHGKILSLTEKDTIWSSENIVTGAGDVDDGAVNRQTIADLANADEYPAFVWAGAQGAVWYLPSINELYLIYSLKTTLNASLENKLPAPVLLGDSIYWTSTESSDIEAQTIHFEDGTIGSSLKNSSSYTRVVRTF